MSTNTGIIIGLVSLVIYFWMGKEYYKAGYIGMIDEWKQTKKRYEIPTNNNANLCNNSDNIIQEAKEEK